VVCRGIDMSGAAGGTEAPEFESFFVRTLTALSVIFATQQSALSLVNVPNVGASGGASAELLVLLQLIRSQPGLRLDGITEKTARLKRTIERWLKQLKPRYDVEFRGVPKSGGYH
jgi:hypothetical protein